MLATCACVTSVQLHFACMLDMEIHINHSADAFFREHHEFMRGLRTANAMNGRCVDLKHRAIIFITECVKIADVDCNWALPRSERKTRMPWSEKRRRAELHIRP